MTKAEKSYAWPSVRPVSRKVPWPPAPPPVSSVTTAVPAVGSAGKPPLALRTLVEAQPVAGLSQSRVVWPLLPVAVKKETGCGAATQAAPGTVAVTATSSMNQPSIIVPQSVMPVNATCTV